MTTDKPTIILMFIDNDVPVTIVDMFLSCQSCHTQKHVTEVRVVNIVRALDFSIFMLFYMVDVMLIRV